MNSIIPDYFKPILWEYDFSRVSPDRSPKILIEKAINYGDLRHWKWIAQHYGVREVHRMLTAMSSTEIRPAARVLAGIVFSGIS